MRYMNVKRVIALVLLLAVAGVVGFGRTDNPPSDEEKDFAQRTSDLLHNELFAALLQEFSETTPENVEEGKLAISLIFNNSNRDIRLVGRSFPLLGGLNNLPDDSFERRSLALALQGQGNTSRAERVGNRWYYRRSVPLNSSMHSSCVLCHANFASNQWVGALMTRVPI
ncbi:MAG TPA: hypothetical protein VJQ56_01980, partial [Blastocatellia bacterium]|nr:hypothetical protein [Blastocatellia bacterium]